MTAVPLPGISRFARHEVSGSLVLHPLRKPQQNPGVIILRVNGWPGKGGGGRQGVEPLVISFFHSPSIKTNDSTNVRCVEVTRPGGFLTRRGSSPRQRSAGRTWASSARRRRSGCNTDREPDQEDLETGPVHEIHWQLKDQSVKESPRRRWGDGMETLFFHSGL